MTSLAAGQHRVRFEGDRYQPFERTVDVGRGQTIDLGAIQLKIAKAKLTLEVSDNNAKVVLTDVDAHSERTIKGPFPATLDLDGGHRWLVTATARGSRDFATDVSFDDGQADKTVRVALTSGSNGSGGPVVASGPAAAPAPRAAARAKEDASDDDAKPAPSGAMGSLNMNSLPPSKVLLDGRPLGSTPKVGVSVPAGTHTVTFVHPDLGRKTVSVNVPANGEASAGVRFKKEED
jgi:serine/threonine-protein kinase